MQNQVSKGSTNYRDNERNEEIADVLTAISVVAKRLAQKLTMLARQEKPKTEGGKLNEMLADYFSATNEQPTSQAAVPAEKPISLEQVRAVLAEKSRAGYTAEVRALLEKHGASKLSEIDPAEYSTLLKEAEALGNG